MQYSANSAQQAGIDFNHLAAYITVISSTTQQSAEMIGTSLRAISTRMEAIKSGKKLDIDGESINGVEESLHRVGIELRDGIHGFRDMQDVIKEVGERWETFSETDKSFIAGQIAGQRQAEQFKVLMTHQLDIQKALRIETQATGLAQQRYNLYLESTESKANKMQAALEGVWQKTISSKTIGQVYDLITATLNLVDVLGGLIPIMTALTGVWIAFNLAFIQTQVIALSGFLTPIIEGIMSLLAILPTATSFTQGFSMALSGIGAGNAVVLAITAVVLAIQAYNTQIVETNKLGVSDNVDHWVSVFEKIKTGSNNATDTLKAFKEEIEKVNKAVSDAGPIVGAFVDKQSVIENGLSGTIETLGTATTSYEEYSKSVNAALETAGYHLDKLGNLYTITEQGSFRYNESIKILTKSQYEAAAATYKTSDAFKEQEKAAADASFGLFQIDTQLKGLKDTADLTGSMIAKSLNGEKFNFEDVQKLTDANKEYVQFIDIVDGQVQINTEGLRKYDLQKALDATATFAQEVADNHHLTASKEKLAVMDDLAMKTAGFTEAEIKQIDIMRAYSDSLADGSAYAEQLAEAQKKLSAEREKAARDALEAEKKEANFHLEYLKEQKKSADDLLKMVMDMIKQEKQAEKEHLQEQIQNYSDLIDARIAALDALKNEEDYKAGLKKDVKKQTDIKNQIAILMLDNSPEAKAKILKLQEELAGITEDIQKKQRDHRLELEKAALQKEKEEYKKSMGDKIKIIEDYLKQTGTITNDALDLIKNHGDELYQRLLDWNRIYGTGIDKDITEAWNKGREAVLNYSQLIIDINTQEELVKQLNAIDLNVTQPWNNATTAADNYLKKLKEINDAKVTAQQNNNPTNPIPPMGNPDNPTPGGIYVPPPLNQPFHSGIERGPIGNLKTTANERFIKAMDGEVVVNDSQQNNFLKNVIPNIAKTTSNMINMGGNHYEIGSLMTFTGNVDKSVLPDIRKIANEVLDVINKGNLQKGIKRSTNLNSI